MAPPPLPPRTSNQVPRTPAEIARDYATGRRPIIPFEINFYVHPEATGPIARTGRCPKVTGKAFTPMYAQQPQSPMDADAVFFTDPTFKRDVRDFFGFTVQNHN